MRNHIYTCKGWESLQSFIHSINQDEIAFFLIFAPYKDITKENIKIIEKTFTKDYVVVSTTAVLNKDSFEEDTIQCISFSFEKNGSHRISFRENISENPEIFVKFLEEKVNNYDTSLIFSTTSNVAMNILLEKINISQDSSLIGGVASSNDPNFNTRVVYNGKFIDDGFIIIQLKNIHSLVSASLGFIPVGPAYRITKSKLNRIYELDGIDIYMFLERILKGTGLSPEDLDMEKTKEYLWNFPIIIIDRNFGYASISRTPKMFSIKEKALKFWGNFKEGDQIKISIGDPDDIVENTEMDVRLFKVNWIEKKANPELILNFYCVARLELLKKNDVMNVEASIYRRLFRSKLIAGMTTFGEIAPDKSENKVNFYNQTSILLALWEE